MARCEDYSEEEIQQERGPEVREPGAKTQRNSVGGRGAEDVRVSVCLRVPRKESDQRLRVLSVS